MFYISFTTVLCEALRTYYNDMVFPHKILFRLIDWLTSPTMVTFLWTVDGSWGQWSSWSACSVTCGRGTRTMRRDCYFLVTNNMCTKRCRGKNKKRQRCWSDGQWTSERASERISQLSSQSIGQSITQSNSQLGMFHCFVVRLWRPDSKPRFPAPFLQTLP